MLICIHCLHLLQMEQGDDAREDDNNADELSDNDDNDHSLTTSSAATIKASVTVKSAMISRDIVPYFMSDIGGTMTKNDSNVAVTRFICFLDFCLTACGNMFQDMSVVHHWQAVLKWLLRDGVVYTGQFTTFLANQRELKPSTILNYLGDINRVLIWYQLFNHGK